MNRPTDPSLIAAIFHAVQEADQKAIRQEDQHGFVTFYTFPCGPWHKIIGLVRQLPVSEADLLPYLAPPPEQPLKLMEDPRAAAGDDDTGPMARLDMLMFNCWRAIIELQSHPTDAMVKEMADAMEKQWREVHSFIEAGKIGEQPAPRREAFDIAKESRVTPEMMAQKHGPLPPGPDGAKGGGGGVGSKP